MIVAAATCRSPSAVALAAALGADRCDIYTDVEGVYTSDPRIVQKARKIERITYEEMLEMASLGARVLETRSVALASAGSASSTSWFRLPTRCCLQRSRWRS